jgi:hypothetical protein
MKFYQWASLGLAAVLLGGCGGIKAYVPAGNTAGTGNPAQCASLIVSNSSTITIERDSTSQEGLSVSNGLAQALQSRAGGEGDATVTISLVNAPAGFTSQFTPNPLTVPLNTVRSVDWDLAAAQSLIPGNYTFTLRVQEGSCTAVDQTITLIVTNSNQND